MKKKSEAWRLPGNGLMMRGEDIGARRAVETGLELEPSIAGAVKLLVCFDKGTS